MVSEKITWLSLNTFFQVLSPILAYVADTGVFGYSNSDISKMYQNLITPAGLGFSIWGFIFIFEAIATIYSFFNPSLVKSYVKYWIIAANVFQILWTIFFGGDHIVMSFLMMFGIWVSLSGAVYSIYEHKQMNGVENVYKEYWLVQLGYTLHYGWITAATFLNLNIVFVAEGAKADIQIALAILTLVALICFTNFMGYPKSNFFKLKDAPGDCAFTFVSGWALANISAQVKQPIDMIQDTFPTIVTDGIYMATSVLSVYSFCLLAYTLFNNLYFGNKSDMSQRLPNHM